MARASWEYCRARAYSPCALSKAPRLFRLLARSEWPWGYLSLGKSCWYILTASREKGSGLAFSPLLLQQEAQVVQALGQEGVPLGILLLGVELLAYGQRVFQ